jgi:hypothetical protein
MIKAYAGTAKTTTLVMLSKELPNIPTLALAFNKAISVELKSRMPKNIDVSTLNAVGHRAWMRKLGNEVSVTVKNDKVRTLTDEIIRELDPSAPRSSRAVAAPASNARSAAWLDDKIPRGFKDLAPPERDGLLKLIVAAGKCQLVPSHFITAGETPDTPSSWAKLAADCSLPAPGPDQIHLARQMLIDLAAIPPPFALQQDVPLTASELRAEVVELVKSARMKGLVPSYFTAHSGLVPDAEEAWVELAQGCSIFDPAAWKLALARKVLVRSILAAYSGTIDFDDQIYCSALLGGKYQLYQVGRERRKGGGGTKKRGRESRTTFFFPHSLPRAILPRAISFLLPTFHPLLPPIPIASPAIATSPISTPSSTRSVAEHPLETARCVVDLIPSCGDLEAWPCDLRLMT